MSWTLKFFCGASDSDTNQARWVNLDQKYFKSQNETNNTAVEDRFIFSCYVAVGLFALSVFFEIIGSQDIVLYLLENGADIDMFNNHHNTPFFLATESLQKEICQVRNSDFTWLSISYDRFKERDREALWESHWTPDWKVWVELWPGDCAAFMREMLWSRIRIIWSTDWLIDWLNDWPAEDLLTD